MLSQGGYEEGGSFGLRAADMDIEADIDGDGDRDDVLPLLKMS